MQMSSSSSAADELADKDVTVLRDWRDVVAELRAHSPDALAAQADAERARAAVRSSMANALPSLNANWNGSYVVTGPKLVSSSSLGLPSIDPFTERATLSLSVPLFAPSAWYNISQASKTAEARGYTADDAMRRAELGAAGAVVDMVTAERVLEINRISLSAAEDKLKLVRKKFELGAATRPDVLRVEQDAITARSAVISSDESRRQAREALALALGSDKPVRIAPSLRIDEVVRSLTAACLIGADPVAERPDVKAATASVEAIERAKSQVVAQYLPTFSAGSQIATSVRDWAPTWSISGLLSIPIWDGGARYGAGRDVAAQAKRADVTREQTTRTARIELARSERAVKVSEETLEVTRQSTEAARENDRLVTRSFEEGRGTSLELVTAGASLRQAEVQLVVKEYEALRAKAAFVLSRTHCELK